MRATVKTVFLEVPGTRVIPELTGLLTSENVIAPVPVPEVAVIVS